MDVISLPIEMGASKVDSRYRLVVIASERTRQIMDGGAPLIEARHAKPTTLALHEVLAGKMELLYGEEALHAQQEAKRLREVLKRSKRSPLFLSERELDTESALKKEMTAYLEASAKEN